MLMTLISMFGGGLMRLLPELLVLFNKKTDHQHELAMLDRQVELEKTRATTRAVELQQASADLQFKGGVDQVLGLLDAQKAALAGQMQKTGIAFVDALNFLVRPLTTYYFLGCYGLYKTALGITALQQVDAWSAIGQCYTAEDSSILAGLISFWFVGRAVEKRGSP